MNHEPLRFRVQTNKDGSLPVHCQKFKDRFWQCHNCNRHLLDYSATKGAIHAMTKSLASSLLPRGMRVNAVAPGPVWTPLNPADSPPDKASQFGKKADMGRAAQPEELSPAYVFLAAPVCSGYITGSVLPVTGSVGAI